MLFTMMEAGERWKNIREAWKELTGTKPGRMTLQIRYNQIRENLEHLAEGDVYSLFSV